MSDDGRIQIRSYRVCFALERRIHKIDRWRIPVPFGVPLIGIGYAVGALIALLLLGSVPAVGTPIGALHPALRLVVIPVVTAYLLCRWEIDGRPSHVGLARWARYLVGPRRLVAFQSVPTVAPVARLGQVTLAADESGPKLRRGIVNGPAVVILRYSFSARTAGRTMHVRQKSAAAHWRGKQVSLKAGSRMVVR